MCGAAKMSMAPGRRTTTDRIKSEQKKKRNKNHHICQSNWTLRSFFVLFFSSFSLRWRFCLAKRLATHRDYDAEVLFNIRSILVRFFFFLVHFFFFFFISEIWITLLWEQRKGIKMHFAYVGHKIWQLCVWTVHTVHTVHCAGRRIIAKRRTTERTGRNGLYWRSFKLKYKWHKLWS